MKSLVIELSWVSALRRIYSNGVALETIDAKGCYILPGLIDLHFHGCNGYDFCDGTIEAVKELAEYEHRTF